MNADVYALLQAGRLEQVCPTCGLREAAGRYCTACTTPTGEPHWRRGQAHKSQGDARRVHAEEEPAERTTDLGDRGFGGPGGALTLGFFR